MQALAYKNDDFNITEPLKVYLRMVVMRPTKTLIINGLVLMKLKQLMALNI